ncbi:myb/SANT-like DNA-binding domain-containing protein 4 [Clinocottus analis]|uniref:myb/SANT-like DNA-binding domain-containing protein 4 n=1 Tax=Clinocottus analis TaxID=304258 RepID=UPI0035BF14EA
MEINDHAYTSTTYDKFTPVEFTYKMSTNEVEDLVKLRVSNKYLFSGRRNTSMWAWRAILKHMGLEHKMTHNQASKKWENMKKRYKGLKNPPEGMKVFPDAWPHFNLMDDAMEGRLEGSAPILKAISTNDDYPIISKPKRRKLSMAPDSPPVLLAAGPEIEVSLNGDEDEEAAEESSWEMDRAIQEMDHGRDMLDNERRVMEREKRVMEREKQVVEREQLVLQRERATLDREVAALDRDRASLERERATMEREKAVMERERVLVDKDRDVVSRDRLALEKEKALLDRLSTTRERTEEVTEDGSSGKDSTVTDRKEQFLNLFEKLIENL